MKDNKEIRQLIRKCLDKSASFTEQAQVDMWLENDMQVYHWISEQIENCSPYIETNVRQRFNRYIAENGIGVTSENECVPIPMGKHAASTANIKIWKYGFAASIVAMMALCGMFIYNIVDQSRDYKEFKVATDIGERSTATLPDGSTVRLNHLSDISFRYDPKSKQRVLDLKGEAMFDIETDPEHPFIVNCDGLQVECHGTAFNVKGYPDENEITVVLREGSITATTLKQAVKMKPGTKVSYDKRSKYLQSSMVDIRDYDGWANGDDRFDNECFDRILKAVSRRYGVKIDILSPSLRDVRLSGSIAKKDLDETLRIFSLATGSRYVIESDSTISFFKEP